MSRGQGRVYKPKVRGKKTAVWWLDFTVGEQRYRESSGTEVQADAFTKLAQRRREVEMGAPAVPLAPTTLGAFVAHHIAEKTKAGKFTAGWVTANAQYLARAVEHFGAARRLASVTGPDVGRWVQALGTSFEPGSIHHHLNALSNCYRRASAEGVVPSGTNPVRDFKNSGEAPTRPDTEAEWLEVSDAALLLEAARTFPHDRADKGGRTVLPFIYPLIATLLLTGGRETEVLGLEVADVSFDRETVTFRPNAWRRLKTRGSSRTVPLLPQLAEILRPYVFNTNRPPSRLLFPSPYLKREGMVNDWRKSLDAVAVRAGWQAEEIRSKMFRHTYATARLQTLDHGAPVASWTVAKELGHASTKMIEATYGHLGAVRHRAEVVEYRIEQHLAKLGDRARVFALTSGKQSEVRVA